MEPGLVQREASELVPVAATTRASRRRRLVPCVHCGDQNPDHLGRDCPEWSWAPAYYSRCSYCGRDPPDHPGRLCGWHPAAIAGAVEGSWPLSCPVQGCTSTIRLHELYEQDHEFWSPHVAAFLSRLIREGALLPNFCFRHFQTIWPWRWLELIWPGAALADGDGRVDANV